MTFVITIHGITATDGPMPTLGADGGAGAAGMAGVRGIARGTGAGVAGATLGGAARATHGAATDGGLSTGFRQTPSADPWAAG